MKKTTVKVLCYLLSAAAGVAAGCGGTYAVLQAAQPDAAAVQAVPAQPQPAADTVQLRVRGGAMEWFDGVRWNTASTVESLRQNDIAEAQTEAWHTLAQQRVAAKEAQRQQSLALLDKEQNALPTGEKPASRQQTTTRPSTGTQTQPTPTQPTPTPTPAPDPTPPPASSSSPPPESEWSGDYE